MTVVVSAALKPLKPMLPAVPALLPVKVNAVLPKPVTAPVPVRLPVPVGPAPENATPVSPVKLPSTVIEVTACAVSTPLIEPFPDKLSAPLLLMAVRAPVARVPSVKLLLPVICVVPPARFTVPLKSLPLLVSEIAPLPPLSVAAPAVMLLPAVVICVIPLASTFNAPATVPEVSMVPVNVPLPMLTAPPAWLASPVRMSTAPPNVVMAALAVSPRVTTQDAQAFRPL